MKRQPRPSGTQDNRIAIVHEATNITFQDLGFDANGIERFGGVGVKNSTNVLVQFVHCFDSNRTGPSGYDRYMFDFNNCTNLTVQNSHWEDLQMEVDRCKTVRIRRNLVERPGRLAASARGATLVVG